MPVFGSKFSSSDIQTMFSTMNQSINYYNTYEANNSSYEAYFFSYLNTYSDNSNYVNDKVDIDDYSNQLYAITSTSSKYLDKNNVNIKENDIVERDKDLAEDPLNEVFEMGETVTVKDLRDKYVDLSIAKAQAQKKHAMELLPRIAAYKKLMDGRSFWDKFKGFFTGENRALKDSYNRMKGMVRPILTNGCIDSIVNTLTDKNMSENKKVEINMTGRINAEVKGKKFIPIKTFEMQREREQSKEKEVENNNINNKIEIVNEEISNENSKSMDGKEHKKDLGKMQNQLNNKLEEETGVESIGNKKSESIQINQPTSQKNLET